MDGKCPRCGDEHPLIRCLFVKAMEFEYGGDLNSMRRVEFLTPADYGRPTAPPDAPPEQTYPTLKDINGPQN